MTPAALIASLRAAGVDMVPAGDNLRLQAPGGTLTPDLLAAVEQHKPALLQLLVANDSGPGMASAPPHPQCPAAGGPAQHFMATVNAWPPDTRELWSERAAIMQYDGGLSRDAAELAAFNLISASPVPEPDPAPAAAPTFSSPACGHDNAMVLLQVRDHGLICGACWSRWVAGNIAWPESTRRNHTNSRTNNKRSSDD